MAAPSEAGGGRIRVFVSRFGGWLLIGFLLGIFGVVVSAIPDTTQGAGALDACPAAENASPPPPLDANTVPVPLSPEQAGGVVIDFWKNRSPQAELVYLDAAKKKLQAGEKIASLPPDMVFDVSKRPLYRQGVDGNIAPEQYVAVAQVTAPKEVTLTVCANPEARNLDAGTYAGSVRIRDPRIEDVTVPVTVTVQYPFFRPIIFLFGVVVFLSGSFFVWASGRKTTGKPIWQWTDALEDLPAWLLDNYVGVVTGVITAGSVFLANYWHNPVWGAKAPDEWFTLLGGMFTAYTAAFTTTSALVHPRSRKAATSQPATPDQGKG